MAKFKPVVRAPYTIGHEQFLKILEEKGINFTFHITMVYPSPVISVEQVMAFAADQNGFLADYYGVTRETIAQYIAHMDDMCQCQEILRNGKRCARWDAQTAMGHPEQFVPGLSDRCAIHRRKAQKMNE